MRPYIIVIVASLVSTSCALVPTSILNGIPVLSPPNVSTPSGLSSTAPASAVTSSGASTVASSATAALCASTFKVFVGSEAQEITGTPSIRAASTFMNDGREQVMVGITVTLQNGTKINLSYEGFSTDQKLYTNAAIRSGRLEYQERSGGSGREGDFAKEFTLSGTQDKAAGVFDGILNPTSNNIPLRFEFEMPHPALATRDRGRFNETPAPSATSACEAASKSSPPIAVGVQTSTPSPSATPDVSASNKGSFKVNGVDRPVVKTFAYYPEVNGTTTTKALQVYLTLSNDRGPLDIYLSSSQKPGKLESIADVDTGSIRYWNSGMRDNFATIDLLKTGLTLAKPDPGSNRLTGVYRGSLGVGMDVEVTFDVVPSALRPVDAPRPGTPGF